MDKTRRSLRLALASGTVLAAYAPVMGQYTSQFEAPTYNGSATGTVTTGQDGWFIPTAGGADGFVFTGNPFSVVTNPNGCSQLEGGQCLAGNVIRAQHLVTFTEGAWATEFDINASWTAANGAVLPAAEFIGSFSLQPSFAQPEAATRAFQQLAGWGSAGPITPYPGGPAVTNWTATADHFHIAFGFVPNAAAAAFTFQLASAAWQDLPTNHWYHIRVKWNFTAAQITEVAITDLTAGTPQHVDDVTALNWYLIGGPGSTLPLPTGARLFTGSGVAGDVVMWDNFSIGPISAPVLPACATACYANCDSSTIPPCLNVLDFGCFLNKFASGDTNANCDASTIPPVLNVLDFGCFLNKFASGCSNC